MTRAYNLTITLLAVAFLALLLFDTAHGSDYNRTDHFGGWIDADGDCQDTRQEVLIEESLVPVELTADGCRVLTGLWLCEYTGQLIGDPQRLDIDHRVPLKEAWLSGADQWTAEQRTAYANDLDHPEHLLAVENRANRTKGAQDPAGWLPEVSARGYVVDWVKVKQRYHLAFDADEVQAIMGVVSFVGER